MNDEPVWQSEEWKQARKELLADQCQQCESTEKLSLVHLWKPPRYRVIRARVEHEFLTDLVDSGQIEAFSPENTDEKRASCPSCNSINLRLRKTKQPKYKCNRCNAEFSEPDEVIVRDDYLYNQLYKTWKIEHLQGFDEKIEEKITELRSQYDQDYRSGKGTTTMCGKCAFLWTQKQMKFCITCGENYHHRRFKQCYSCHQNDNLVTCEKCETTRIQPQPGDINICEKCLEKMWLELTD